MKLPAPAIATLFLSLALASCSEAVHVELQRDQLAYNEAREKLYADETSGSGMPLHGDAVAYQLALDQLRYDRLDWPDPNGGHSAGGGSHGHHGG